MHSRVPGVPDTGKDDSVRISVALRSVGPICRCEEVIERDEPHKEFTKRSEEVFAVVRIDAT